MCIQEKGGHREETQNGKVVKEEKVSEIDETTPERVAGLKASYMDIKNMLTRSKGSQSSVNEAEVIHYLLVIRANYLSSKVYLALLTWVAFDLYC